MTRPCKKLAEDLIYMLNSFRGFDHWWEQIQEEDKNVILDAMSEIICEVVCKEVYE